MILYTTIIMMITIITIRIIDDMIIINRRSSNYSITSNYLFTDPGTNKCHAEILDAHNLWDSVHTH